jgi:hypothetical protein
MTERRFIVTKEEDTFLLGHFENEQSSGVYLPPEYLGRLRQIQQAVGVRLDRLGLAELPDALKNLLGVLDRLTTAQSVQMRLENAPPTAGDREAYAAAQRELEEAMKELENFPRPPNRPGRK